MVEAMVMGKPVVATDIRGSGVPWVNVHGVTGFNTPVSDPASLASALNTLLNDPDLRRRMGVAARARYLREFNADWMTDMTIRLYESLMRRSPSSSANGVWREPRNVSQSGD